MVESSAIQSNYNVDWFNKELNEVRKNLNKWLSELGYKVEVIEKTITIIEKDRGQYKTKKYIFKIDKNLEITILPIGLSVIGARARIDIVGPVGKEKIVYFISNETEMKINNDGWYWYDDSSYGKVENFSKTLINPLLERMQ